MEVEKEQKIPLLNKIEDDLDEEEYEASTSITSGTQRKVTPAKQTTTSYGATKSSETGGAKSSKKAKTKPAEPKRSGKSTAAAPSTPTVTNTTSPEPSVTTPLNANENRSVAIQIYQSTDADLEIPPPDTFTCYSIYVMLCCCFCLGLMALRHSRKVLPLHKSGDRREAILESEKAQTWAVRGIQVGGAVIIAVTLVALGTILFSTPYIYDLIKPLIH